MSQKQDAKSPSGNPLSAASGVVLLGAAVAVFIVCSLIQAACGSSMFSSQYADTGFLKGLLINVTFYPGWALTALLAISGVKEIVNGGKSG